MFKSRTMKNKESKKYKSKTGLERFYERYPDYALGVGSMMTLPKGMNLNPEEWDFDPDAGVAIKKEGFLERLLKKRVKKGDIKS